MPRKFFRFPVKDRHDPTPPTPAPAPAPPPKPHVSKPSPLESWKETLRNRRITSPNLSAPASGNGQHPPVAHPHRVSASDSMAQGTKWRGIFPNAEQLRRESRKSSTSRNSNGNSNTNLSSNGEEPGGLSPPPLRRAKPHHVIEEERQRRANAENLLNEQSKLKEEINQDTIRLSKIQQKRQAIQEERERVEKEKERITRETARSPENINTNLNVNPTAHTTAYTNKNMNGYGKSQSAPSLPNWSSYTPYPSYAAYTSANSPHPTSRNQSKESFQTNSTHEPDFRRVHSRTPSGSSNDRSPPPAPHWQRIEQARKEREREKMMSKLAEAREREREAFESAWAMYESRWMLLTFAIRSATSVPSSAQQSQRPKSMQSMQAVQPIHLGPPTSLSLSFKDIPWPLLHPPRTCDDITTMAIRKFLASDYQSIDKSHRERIKEALLRWHPDRFGSRILDYVRPEERDKVTQGVDVVVRCLNELLSKH